MTNNKGITLIALVITIIVLLILAGVSIAMLTGQNGILTRATEATDESLKSEAEEAVKLAIATIRANAASKDAGTAINETTDPITMSAANIATVIKQNNPSAVITATSGDAGEVRSLTYQSRTGGEKVTVSIAADNSIPSVGDPQPAS